MRWLFVLPVVLLAAGCGGGDGEGTATTDAGGPADIEVFASEYAFAPPFVIVDKPGTYTLSLRNDGNVPHNLTIEGVGKTGNVEPGETRLIEVTVKPGNYQMVCTLHVAEAMDGEFVVHGS